MDNAITRKKRTFAIIKLAVLALIIIGVPAVLYFFYRDTLFNKEWLSHLPSLLSHYHKQAAFILVGLQVLQVIICIVPGQPIQFAASYMFGVFKGYLISIIGAIIGAFLAFYIAKILGKDAVSTLFGEERVEDYRRKLNSGRGLTAVLLIYLIPGVPKDLTAYVAGISDMHIRPFLLVSTIGRTPPMLGSLLIGHFVGRGNYKAVVILSIVVAIILIIFFIKRKAVVALLDDIGNKETEKQQ